MSEVGLPGASGEPAADLTWVRYSRLGGWLVVFVITLALQCLYALASCAISIALLVSALQSEDFVTAAILLASVFSWIVPFVTGGLSLLLLLKRRISFRIPFTIHVLLLLLGTEYWVGETLLSAIAFLLLLAVWLVYVYTSNRVRVFCGLQPRPRCHTKICQ